MKNFIVLIVISLVPGFSLNDTTIRTMEETVEQSLAGDLIAVYKALGGTWNP